MSEEQATTRGELLSLTTEIVSAHLSSNPLNSSEVPGLVQTVFDTLLALGRDEEPAPVELTPAVPIKRSVTDDHLICLEDGKKLKMLRRHLMTAYGMTPEEYRPREGLDSRLLRRCARGTGSAG
jgi:predicted transcriptional regulator